MTSDGKSKGGPHTESCPERSECDAIYRERAQCVALIARLATELGCKCGLGRHEPDPDPSWDPNWMNVVYVDLPAGQVSWHIAYEDLPLFNFLPGYDDEWDGHDTAEKYRRTEQPVRGVDQIRKRIEALEEMAHPPIDLSRLVAERAEALARIIEVDSHTFGSRPCQTCNAASGVLGRAYGCVAFRKNRPAAGRTKL